MIYLIIAIVLLMLGVFDIFYKDKEKKELILKVIIVCLILFLGTRGFLGWDWYFYYPSFMEGTYTYEKGYMLYTSFIGNIFKNYIFYQFVTTTIDFIALYYIFKRYCKYPIMAFAIFFSIQGFHMEVELLRNMKAIILFLFSLKYIEERKIIPFLLLNIIGVSFHMSGILYLPMYFILNYTYEKRIVLGIFIIGSFYYLLNLKGIELLLNYNWDFLPTIIADKIVNYKSILPANLERGLNLFYIERAILFLLAYKYENNNIIKNSLYIWVVIFLFTSELSVASLRIGILFIYSVWLTLTRSLENFERKEFMVAIVMALSLIRIYRSTTFPGNTINYNYKNALFNELNYKERELEIIKGKKYLKESHGKELLIQY
ncbi:EpsG family protein [Cetobacterium sp. ZOR0034]|uniref:EpsG family protein n=1 Tax=Cetobacterium sp. ZOR0034 TaxID=1339239 RepID=UPI000690E6BE|nr:EpsG family protein [Cetobacterium sp. ZOR0034]